MEEMRDDHISAVISWLQAKARGRRSRIMYKQLQQQKMALYCIQRTIRNYHIGRGWLWWELWLALKPKLKCSKFVQYKAEYESKIAFVNENMPKAIAECNNAMSQYKILIDERDGLRLALKKGGSAVQDIIDKTKHAEASRNDLQRRVDDVQDHIKLEEETILLLTQQTNKTIQEAERLKGEVQTLEARQDKFREELYFKDSQIQALKEEFAHQEELIAKLAKDKKAVIESKQKTEEDSQGTIRQNIFVLTDGAINYGQILMRYLRQMLP